MNSLGSRRWILTLAILLAYVLVGLLALRLSIEHFQQDLNSDHLYPHIFMQDLLYGAYPIDAWKFGSANFIFPDYLLYIPLYWVCGESGVSFPLYSALIYLLLAGSLSFFYYRFLQCSYRIAALWGAVSMILILGCQFFSEHGVSLYFISLPGFHGSSQAIGILCLGLLIGSLVQSRLLHRWEVYLFYGLAIPALFSNTLLLTQFLIPWLSMLLLVVFRGQSRDVFKQHSVMIIASLFIVLAVKFLFQINDYWDYGKLFRHYPVPSLIWKTWLDFLSDFPGELWPQMYAFWILLFLVSPVIMWAPYGLFRLPEKPVARGLLYFVLLSLLSGIALPICALYWKNFYNTRYFLNLLWLPTAVLCLGLFFLLKARFNRTTWNVGLPLLVVFLLFGSYGVGRSVFTQTEKMHFPYPAKVAELDQLVKTHALKNGLSHYWQSHYYNQLSHQDTAYLNHVRESGAPYYWCNNVYWYWGNPLSPNEATQRSFPRYDFVLMKDLDEAQIIANYGEPDEIVEGTYNKLFLYRDGGKGIYEHLSPLLFDYLKSKQHVSQLGSLPE